MKKYTPIISPSLTIGFLGALTSISGSDSPAASSASTSSTVSIASDSALTKKDLLRDFAEANEEELSKTLEFEEEEGKQDTEELENTSFCGRHGLGFLEIVHRACN